MKVVVPFAPSTAWPLQATRLALAQDGVDAEFRHMTDEESYFRLLSELWSGAESFITVEHDIVVWPGAIQQLADCPHEWCTVPYYCSVGWIEDGLGCTKFSSSLIGKIPEMFTAFPGCCAHTKNYCGLDRLIAHQLTDARGFRPHVHSPGVANLNERWT